MRQSNKKTCIHLSQSKVFQNNKNNLILKVLFLSFLFYIIKADVSISVSPSLRTINENTTYLFNIVDDNFPLITNTSALIQITFPSSFFTFNISQTYTCNDIDTVTLFYPCRAISSNVITINNPMRTNEILRVSIATIKNPSSADAITLTYKFKYTNNTAISQATSNSPSYNPGSLRNCTASFSPNLVHQIGQVTINMVLGNQVPQNGKITVQFPSSWTYAVNSSFPPLVTSATQVCRRVTTNNFLMSNLSCQVLSISRLVILASVINNTSPSGTALSFAISNILSPPTTFSGYTITVQTYTDTSGQIDKSSCNIGVLGARSISSISSTTQLSVGGNTSYLLQFVAPTPIMANDRISIMALSPNIQYFGLYAANFGFISPGGVLISGQNSNTSSIAFALPSVTSVISASTTIRLQSGFFIKPLINSGVRSLSLVLRRDSVGYIYANQSFSLTIGSNLLQNVTITPNTLFVQTASSYTFSFTLFNQLAVKSKIIIILPNQLSTTNGNCTATITSSTSNSFINSSNICAVTINRVITISYVNSVLLPAGDRVGIVLNSILNSQTTQETGKFTISTYYGQTLTAITDTSNDKSVKMVAALIGFASVASLSRTVAQQTVYTIVYQVRTKFLSNSKVKIGLPSDISIGSSLSSKYFLTIPNATNSSNPTITSQQSCSITNYTANSTQFLELSGISTTLLNAFTTINMKISFLKNPTSLKPSNSFSIYQVDINGYEIQKIQAGLIITNNATNTFVDFFAIQSPTRINGQSAVYSVNFKSTVIIQFYPFQVDLLANDFILLEFQTKTNTDAQFYFSNPMASCEIKYTQNGTNITQSTSLQLQSTTLLKVILTQNLLSSQTYQIAIDSIKRPRTAQSFPSKLSFKSFRYASSTSSFGISTGSLQPVSNNKQNSIQTVTLNILTSPSQLLSYQTFSINVIVKNHLIAGDYLILQIPNIYMFNSTIISTNSSTNLTAISTQNLCIQTSVFCSHFNSDPYRIKVQQSTTNFSSTASLTFTIKNNLYLSPSTFSFAGYYFKASSYSLSNLIIDSTLTSTNVTNAQFYLTCRTNLSDYHCKTCNLNGSCSSCYMPITINSTQYTFNGYKYKTSDLKCVSECGAGYFVNNASSICTRCDSPCLTCQNSATTCLSCLTNLTNNKYFSTNNSCLVTCPDTYYANVVNICQQCSPTCLSCTISAITCTSCSAGTFLNSNTKTCGNSSACPGTTFADTSTNKCLPCDISCSSCLGLSNNCTSCATGYILDFNTTTFKNCTNNCPAGTVNDTVNNRGCRCEDQCKTCQNTTSTCKTCHNSSTSGYIYFYSNTCLTFCPTGTYAGKINTSIDSCIQCAQTNCKICNSSTCLQCNGNYSVYQGACLSTCPTSFVLQIIAAVRICKKCLIGCINCQKGVSQCSTCDIGYLKQGNSTNTYCTTSCSAGKVNFNNTICYSSCPSGFQNISNVCRSNNTNTNGGVSVQTSLSTTKTIPFPFIISGLILATIIMLSRIILPYLLVSNLLTTVVGILEVLSWLVAIIVTSLEVVGGDYYKNCRIGTIVVIIALIIGFGLNVLGFYFFNKYISKDKKFAQMLMHNQKKAFLKKCPTIATLVISVMLSHKVLQFLFSNFLGSRHFSYKVSNVSQFVPINYVLFGSIIPSILAIIGCSIISYELQSQRTRSASFIASVDSVIVTVFGIIGSIWVANRKSEDYEKDIHQSIGAGKHYQTQQQFAQNKGDDDISQNINEVFLQQSGVRRTNKDKGKNYYYKSARLSQISQHDNQRLAKRTNLVKPIQQVNSKKLQIESKLAQQSSQALIIDGKQKRRNLKQQFQSESQQIDQTHQNLLKHSDNSLPGAQQMAGGIGMISKIHYPPHVKKGQKQKPQQLQKMSNKQKQQLKNKIQNQIDPTQKQKLDVLNKQNDTLIKKKKEKIQQIAKLAESQSQQLKKLQNQDRAKISKIKEAVDLLKRKQIKIQEYLLYTEIIKQQQGQYDEQSNENRQISEINQNTNNIFKGTEDEDKDLEEVINLSPKKVLLAGSLNMESAKRKSLITQDQSDQGNRKSLKKSKSKDKNSVQTKKISKRRQNTSKLKKIRKNQVSDLQVNVKQSQKKYDKEGDQSQNQKSFDSQEQPQLPKTRSNILGQQNKFKSKNRSQQNFNSKKMKRQDILMINVGSNRNNRSQKQFSYFGGQLQDQQGDSAPPKYIHSTEKVMNFKNRNNNVQFLERQNIYDSENDVETLKSFQNLDNDFYDQISPTKFDHKNQRAYQVDQSSDLPQKPKIINQLQNQNDVTIDRKQNKIRKNDGFDIYQNDDDGQLGRPSQFRINSSMNRYANTSQIDYDAILRKNNQNQKLKKLQQIYLPRLESKAGRSKSRRDLNTSKLSKSKQRL